MDEIKLRPAQLERLLGIAFRENRQILITGPAGVGKSDIIAKAAADAGCDLIISHPAVSDPTDVKGLPWVTPGATKATFLPFDQLEQAMNVTKPTVWFLDDLGQATNAVQASYMQLLLAREVGGHRISDQIIFAAATNGRTDFAGVSGILDPVKTRFDCIVELKVSVPDWVKWALSNDMPPEVIAFLRFKPDVLIESGKTADIVNRACPRTWAKAGKWLKSNLPSDLLFPTLAGCIGVAKATELVGFLKNWKDIPDIDGILINPDAIHVPTNISVLYGVSSALAARANAQNFDRIARYLERMHESKFTEFAALTVNDALTRKCGIEGSPGYQKIMCGPIGEIITGSAS